MSLKVEYVPITRLKANPRNPRVAPKSAILAIKNSIEKFGWTNPVLVQRSTNIIIAGHQRVKAAQLAGIKRIPVVYLDLNDVDSLAYNIADNKLAELTDWDQTKLSKLLGELDTEIDLSVLGFNEVDLEQLLPKPEKLVPPPQPLEEIETDIQKGDRFKLGDGMLICGDCVEAMKTLRKDSIDFVMFSPPYWGLRDYGVEGQIGLESHPSEWIEKMVVVCAEIRRVLKKSGSMYLNIGDTYFGSASKANPRERPDLPNPPASWSTRDVTVKPQIKTDGAWLQPKQLLLMPSRLAITLQEEGWILRNDIIWHKPNPMPSSVKDRLNNTYEHIYHFVRSKKYYYDLDAIRQPHKEATFIRQQGNWSNMGKQKLGVDTGVYSRTLGEINKEAKLNPLGKNPGDTINVENPPHRLFASHPNHQRFLETRYHPKGKNPGDYWNIPTHPFPGAHFAVYPEAICEQPILSSCPAEICVVCGKPKTRIVEQEHPGSNPCGSRQEIDSHVQPSFPPARIMKRKTVGWSDCGCNKGYNAGTVLDPMCGAGTTLLVAQKLKRQFIGIELNPKYCQIIINRWEAYTDLKAEKQNA